MLWMLWGCSDRHACSMLMEFGPTMTTMSLGVSCGGYCVSNGYPGIVTSYPVSV